MKIFKAVAAILLTSFSIAYCHFASDVLFNDDFVSLDRDFLKKEYFDSLVVGFCAAIPAVVGTMFFTKKKSI